MVCPSCSSTDLKKLSFVYASGTYDGKGLNRGLVLSADGPGVHIGRSRGTYQSKLSQIAAPPKKRSFVKAILFWLAGMVVVAILSRNLLHSLPRNQARELDNLAGLVYLLILPILLVWIFWYNRRVYPELFRQWDSRFMCQRCGAIIEPQASAASQG